MVTMSGRPSPLPDPLAAGIFTRAEALQHGVTPWRLEASDLKKVGRGIYAHRELELTAQAVALARARAHPNSVLTGVSAAVHHGLPLPYWLHVEDPLAPTTLSFDSAVHYSRAAHVTPSFSAHHREDVETFPIANTPHESVRIATPARTWLSLMPLLSLDYAVAIVDHLIRKPRPRFDGGRTAPYATRESLETMLERYPGMRGIRKARRALALARVGADSVQETRARLAFHAAGLAEPELNTTVRDEWGTPLGTPDFLWYEHKVAAEYDGASHRSEGQFTYDRDKDQRLRSLGIYVVRLYRRDLEPPRRIHDDRALLHYLAQSRCVDVVRAQLGGQ